MHDILTLNTSGINPVVLTDCVIDQLPAVMPTNSIDLQLLSRKLAKAAATSLTCFYT